MVATVAMNRTESRAGHYRVDYPEQNDTDWLKTIKVRRAGSKMELESFAIDPDWTSREGDMGEMGWG
jgi:succinate dehydrogenase/fumarate reductase flavoprotein subunit